MFQNATSAQIVSLLQNSEMLNKKESSKNEVYPLIKVECLNFRYQIEVLIM